MFVLIERVWLLIKNLNNIEVIIFGIVDILDCGGGDEGRDGLEMIWFFSLIGFCFGFCSGFCFSFCFIWIWDWLIDLWFVFIWNIVCGFFEFVDIFNVFFKFEFFVCVFVIGGGIVFILIFNFGVNKIVILLEGIVGWGFSCWGFWM